MKIYPLLGSKAKTEVASCSYLCWGQSKKESSISQNENVSASILDVGRVKRCHPSYLTGSMFGEGKPKHGAMPKYS